MSDSFGRGNSTLKGALKLLPTPAAGLHNYEETAESFTARQELLKAKGINGNGAGTPLPIALKLLPTPKASTNRKSRATLTREGHWGAPGLEQAVEMAAGILPHEYESPDEVQGWMAGLVEESPSTGGSTGQRSSAGSVSPDLRLSPWFVEWMMGMPEGWSDPDCPLSATEFSSRLGYSPAATSSSASGSE